MREKCECFRGKRRHPVLRGLLENLVELVKVRMRLLTRRLKQVFFGCFSNGLFAVVFGFHFSYDCFGCGFDIYLIFGACVHKGY